MNNISFSLLLFIALVNTKVIQSMYSKSWNEKYENKCPKLYAKNFQNYIPAGMLL